MRSIITKEEFIERLTNHKQKIKLIGDYVNLNTKTLFKCYYDHEWISTPCNLLRRGCPHCGGKLPLTKDIVNRRLSIDSRGIQMIGEYKKSSTITKFLCDCGHEWSTTPNSVLSGKGCPRCNDLRLTQEIVNKRLQNEDRGIQMIGEYLGANTKTKFIGGCGHSWFAKPNNILNGQGCSKCNKRGFRSNLPAVIYLIEFSTHLKYGITNVIGSRLTQHRSSGKFKIVMTVACSGNLARKWENDIKLTLGGRYVSQSIMPSGWTETLPIELRQTVIDTMLNIK